MESHKQARFNPCSIGLAIEGQMAFTASLVFRSFNPCSIGLAIEGFHKLPKPTKKKGVSILVLLDQLSKEDWDKERPNKEYRFNPCSIGLAIEGFC